MTNSFNRSNKLNAKNHNARTLQIESLENRELLSVVSPFTNADNLTDYVSAFVSTPNPANTGFLTNLNQDIPLPPQYKAPQLAPAEGGLSVPLVQTAPTSLATNNPAPTLQIAETPLVVELDAPLAVQTTPTALAASSNTPSVSDDNISPSSIGDNLDLDKSLNSYFNEFLVSVKSSSSNKLDVSWTNVNATSYTVQYRLCGSYAWTSKVVKGKTSLSISVKQNQPYEVRVVPQGTNPGDAGVYSGVALGKLSAKVVNKTSDSISIQISNNANIDWLGYVLGIKAQNESSYSYYDVYQGNNASNGNLTYSFQGNVLTIKGLNPNTKYSFQLAQTEGSYHPKYYAISPYTSLSATTAKATTIVVNSADDSINNDGYTSLREAIRYAQDGAVITFASSMKGKTIYVYNSLDIVNKSITIDASSLYDSQSNGPGLTLYCSSSNGDGFIFNIGYSNNVTIKGIKFTGSSGSAITCTDSNEAGTSFVSALINIQNCTFQNLKAGCVIALGQNSSIVNFNNCIFKKISDVGIWNMSLDGAGKVNVTKCNMSYCPSTSIGIINYYFGAKMYISDSEFTHNDSVIGNFGTIEVERCKFLYNTGYIIYNEGDSDDEAIAYVSNVLVAHNKSDDGGACFVNNDDSYMTIYFMTSHDNSNEFQNNDNSASSLHVQDSICSTGTNIRRTNCVTYNNAGLDNNYRPTTYSQCVDSSYAGSCNWTYKDLAGNNRCMGNGIDIGCYEYFSVETKSTTPGKTTIYWSDSGAASYTVQYRIQGTEKWTTKTVKNKTELTIAVKNDNLYEVRVTPEGSSSNNSQIIWAGALSKIGVKVVSKTYNSVTFKISNIVRNEPYTMLGIKKSNESNYFYADVYAIGDWMAFEDMEYHYDNLYYNYYGDTITIFGLDSNTKYDFQFAQYIDFNSILGMPASAISTFTQVSVTTSR